MSPGRGVAASTAEPTRAHTAANRPNGRRSKTDTDAHDPFAALTSPRPRRAPGVRPHPHDLLQEQPVSSGMFDERAGDNAAPKLSGGLSLGPLSSRRIQVSVCGPARKTHLRFTYKGYSCTSIGQVGQSPPVGGRRRSYFTLPLSTQWAPMAHALPLHVNRSF